MYIKLHYCVLQIKWNTDDDNVDDDRELDASSTEDVESIEAVERQPPVNDDTLPARHVCRCDLTTSSPDTGVPKQVYHIHCQASETRRANIETLALVSVL